MFLDGKVDILFVDRSDLRNPPEVGTRCLAGEKSLYPAAEYPGKDKSFYWTLPVITQFFMPYSCPWT
jgi:hypothetical protein